MNWKKIDLNDSYEKDQNILDGYSTNDLLLEVSCNLREINEETVMEQFEKTLASNLESAREVMKWNLKQIVEHAKKERNEE